MLEVGRIFDELAAIGLPGWREILENTVRARLADGAHGDLRRWRATLASLPAAGSYPATLDAPVVSVGPPAFAAAEREVDWTISPFRTWDNGRGLCIINLPVTY
jgi:hypothetical protein